MDYGQNKQFDEGGFTPGVGEQPANLNTTEAIPSLNIEGSWATAEHDTQGLGNSAIMHAEEHNDNSERSKPTMGKIILVGPAAQQATESASVGATSMLSDIGADGDRISEATLRVVKNAEGELDQTGNIGTFYDTIRAGCVKEYVSKAFGRELYNDTGKAA